MSADNGIYIAKFPDGFRVCYAQCIENINYYTPNTLRQKKTLARYFGESPLFEKRGEAFQYAFHLLEQLESEAEEKNFPFVLEDGISYIGEFEEFESILGTK